MLILMKDPWNLQQSLLVIITSMT
uniref:Uncharacterized protein n=1 Tax=Arundo donax TaxID=35708 RepID=A0A0A9HEY9_ARUDO